MWFLHQAIIVGGLGAVYFIVPLAAFLVGLVLTFPRKDAAARRRLPVFLIGLPVTWLLIGLWGGLYWCDWPHTTNQCAPTWKHNGPSIGMLLFVVTTGAFFWRARGARAFAVLYTIINAYFAFVMYVMSGMAVTGVWL